VITILVVLGLFFSYLTYRITHPPIPVIDVNPSYHGLPFIEVKWRSKAGGELGGWFIHGTRGAPAIILCHGYGSSRTEILDLAAVLQGRGYYHILVFNMRGHGQEQFPRTSLGLYEKADLLGAIEYVLSLPEVDKRVGLWGVSMGAYAALAASVEADRVVAVAADSAYTDVESFIHVQTQNQLGSGNRLLGGLMDLVFATQFLVSPTKLSEKIPSTGLANKNLLFITGANSPNLATQTRKLFVETQDQAKNTQKDIMPLEKCRDKTQYEILFNEEKKFYDERILNFFRKAMPIEGFSAPKLNV
jgi:dipeptidyl aminopeptidase/acylaminoacyl peptidase